MGPGTYGVVAPLAVAPHTFATITITPSVWGGIGGGQGLGRTVDIEWRAGTTGGMVSSIMNESTVRFDLVVVFDGPFAWQGLQADGLLQAATFKAGMAAVEMDVSNDGSFEVGAVEYVQGSVPVRGSVLLTTTDNGHVRVRGFCQTAYYGDTAAGTLRLHLAPSNAAAVQAGGSCGDPGAQPSLRWGTARPEVGTLFPMTVQNVPANSNLVLGLVGFDTGSWLGVALPLDLGAAGMPGCVLQVDPVMPWITALPIASASAQWWLPIPGIGELIGVRFVAQALVDAPGANAAGLLLSNGVRGHIGT